MEDSANKITIWENVRSSIITLAIFPIYILAITALFLFMIVAGPYIIASYMLNGHITIPLIK